MAIKLIKTAIPNALSGRTGIPKVDVIGRPTAADLAGHVTGLLSNNRIQATRGRDLGQD